MGSTQSPAKSGVVYRAKERRFLTCTDPSQDAWKLWGLEKLRDTGIPLRRVAMMTRIADDDAAVSSVLCKNCVAGMGSAVYPPPLKHSSEASGTQVAVVDILLELRGPLFKITRLNKNAQFCIAGQASQARTRYLPPLNPPLVTRAVRTGWISGALALDFQREPDIAHCRCQGILMCLELLRLGHSAKDLETALRGVQHPQLKATAQYLALLMRWLKRNPTHPRNLTRTMWLFMLPWITGRLCVGMIPGAFNE